MVNQSRADGGLRELALFAGAGGGILGGKLLGWRTVCAVEYEPYPACVLIARQNDGTLPPFPIWDDVRTFDGRPWRGSVDVVSGGFPCVEVSSAGLKRGVGYGRSALWSEMARIVREVMPEFVFVENGADLITRGLSGVLSDLAEMGFDAEWGVLGAHHAGAPHERERTWLVARHPDRHSEPDVPFDDEASWMPGAGGRLRWGSKPEVHGMANGMGGRMDRLKALGNGQVPAVAALAWRTLRGRQ